MTMRNLIADAGRNAILEGRTIWGAAQDDELREEFIGALMARHLHAATGTPVRTEVPYTTIYCELLGSPISPEVEKEIGNFRADVTAYENNKPIALIEVKKFAEGNPQSICRDLRKGDGVKLSEHARIFAAVMVCQTRDRKLEEQQRRLEGMVGSENVSFSNAAESINRAWQWSFACLERSPRVTSYAR